MKSGNLNFLETSGALQACNGTALPIIIIIVIIVVIVLYLFLYTAFRYWGVRRSLQSERLSCLLDLHETWYTRYL